MGRNIEVMKTDSCSKVSRKQSFSKNTEKDIAERAYLKAERMVTMRLIETLIESLDNQPYPPEENFRKEFIKKVEKAQKEKGKVFKDIKELEKYLSS